uniref:Uncharacterized protein n=1 Tax=Candidatus Kentrum eta TaxID=2126337 RepID=A0A450UWQ4_9GAMM|nr:MAG: hypothetical protein BECKH772A_GA0070896_1008710 [Candidatus Kentron sp. H]VFJ96947.1 MAG: hypothetical protein BECKH772B_GA0070898_101017 [Candidatus Kentron sp. H]VFK02642.1 MAG: hypothetical protein BECKH772C_GA0070978_100977 [Candidatus Kentron sp. H]
MMAATFPPLVFGGHSPSLIWKFPPYLLIHIGHDRVRVCPILFETLQYPTKAIPYVQLRTIYFWGLYLGAARGTDGDGAESVSGEMSIGGVRALT